MSDTPKPGPVEPHDPPPPPCRCQASTGEPHFPSCPRRRWEAVKKLKPTPPVGETGAGGTEADRLEAATLLHDLNDGTYGSAEADLYAVQHFMRRAYQRGLEAGRAEMRERAAAEIPSNWLDPLLTGPEPALRGKGPWGGPDVERLLRAISARVRALPLADERQA